MALSGNKKFGRAAELVGLFLRLIFLLVAAGAAYVLLDFLARL
jgi:hypothetical protein